MNQSEETQPTIPQSKISCLKHPFTLAIVAGIFVIWAAKITVFKSSGKIEEIEVSVDSDTQGRPVIDFRVHNVGDREATINGIRFVVVAVRGKRGIQTAHFPPTAEYVLNVARMLNVSDVRAVKIAQKVEGGKADRFAVRVEFTGLAAFANVEWTLRPFLLTSAGEVKCRAVKIRCPRNTRVQEDPKQPAPHILPQKPNDI